MTAMQMQEAVERLDLLAAKIENMIQRIGPAVQTALDNPLIPDVLKQSALYAVSSFVKQAQKSLAELEKVPATPAALKYAVYDNLKHGWVAVAKGANPLAEQISKRDVVSNHWSGPAFDEYNKVRDLQAKAVSQLEKIADTTSVILGEAASALFDFMLLIVGAVVILIGGLYKGFSMIATVEGAPIGIAVVAFAVVVFLAACVKASITLRRKMDDLADRLSVEEARQTDFEPGLGLWPFGANEKFKTATPDVDKVEDWESKDN
jgi:hypothetical protein